MFDNSRDELRKSYFTVWYKYQQQQPLEPLEQQIAQVMIDHPEYHSIFNDPDRYQQEEFSDDQVNPFLHLALHLALRDQLATNRPTGIQGIYHHLLTTHPDGLTVEHLLMNCLSKEIEFMQQRQTNHDATRYMRRLMAVE